MARGTAKPIPCFLTISTSLLHLTEAKTLEAKRPVGVIGKKHVALELRLREKNGASQATEVEVNIVLVTLFWVLTMC